MGHLDIVRNNMHLCFLLEEGEEAKLLAVEPATGGASDYTAAPLASRIVEVQIPERKNKSFRGAKNFYDTPQAELKYTGHEWADNNTLVITQEESCIRVRTIYTFQEKLPVFSCESEVENISESPVCLEAVTSFCYGNVDVYQKGKKNPADDLQICYANNTWSAECRWVKKSLRECGVIPYGDLCYDRFRIANHSGFSSGEYLPMGIIHNQRNRENLFWQIEHNGAWSWEVGCVIHDYADSFLEKDYLQQIYLQVSGPDMESAHWHKLLQPGGRFRTVPVAAGVCRGNPEDCFSWLTLYRRTKKEIRELPVIFNDYMNCLMGNSTEETLLPLIDAAKEAGCEVFVVDCGWYDSGNWQFTFGDFAECRKRYPNGLAKVMDAIRERGMKAGLWLELEAYGIDSPGAEKLPKEWLFCRNGKPVADSGRYHLDFRNPQVRTHASGVLKRVVGDYGLEYIKIDYNLCLCYGTDLACDSPGEGLLQHNRAYLAWLKEEIRKYPHVTWENCASGGLRMDYAMLSSMDIQSVSDQEDYRIMGFIASNAATAVLPEQAGIWSYPRREGDERETVFNMVSSLLMRIHLGGHLNELSPSRRALVKEAIQYYKEIRREIPQSVPVWPLGTHHFDSGWLVWGLACRKKVYLAVERRASDENRIEIPLDRSFAKAVIGYPKISAAKLTALDNRTLQIEMSGQYTACIIEIA